MLHRTLRWLIAVLVIALAAAYVDWPNNPGLHVNFAGFTVDWDFPVRQGLDLQGGMQVMLQADVPADQKIDPSAMNAARTIVENRINGLGVSEPLIQLQGDRRIIVELPGIRDPDRAIRTFGQTGLLEFIDAGVTPLAEGEYVTTTLGPPTLETGGPSAAVVSPQPTVAAEGTVVPAPTATVAPTATPAATSTPGATTTPVTATQPVSPTVPGAASAGGPVYSTIVAGKDLKSADVGYDEYNRPQINFTFNDEGAKKFGDYTRNNVGKYLVITLDKRVISSPQIQSPITEGQGRITGRFTLDEANRLVIQLKYGALPIPLKVIQNRTVGPTLGQDSVQRSLTAGIIGLVIVVLFMIVYYRLPGVLADVALLIYALVVFALFKLIPVTLTVAGIAGFVLSIGMAVDANILIFERMREELRSGKSLGAAIDAGFARAWTSIKDSNVSTLITCAILFWFGQNFGASIIKGFALTLGIGVLVSMFTAVVVTRNFLHILQEVWFSGLRPADTARISWLFGVSRPASSVAPERGIAPHRT